MTKMKFLKTKGFKIFLTVWIIYIFFLSHYSGSWMADSIIHSSMAFVDNGNFITDDYIKESCKLPENGCDESFYNGHFYSGFGPGGSVLAMPLTFIFKAVLNPIFYKITGIELSIQFKTIILNILNTIFVSSLLSALLSVILYKFLDYFIKEEKFKLLITFLFAFGTIFFIYSVEYSSRVMAGFFLFLSFYLLFKCKREGINNKYLFFSGLSGAFAVSLEYTSGIIFILLSVYLLSFLRNRKIIIYGLGVLIPILLMLSYHYFIFGDPFQTAYGLRANPLNQDVLSNKFFNLDNINIENLWVYFFSLERGLFFFMPFLVFSLFGIYYGLKKRELYKECILILSILIAHIVLLFFMDWGWNMDGAFGPRYLTTIIPFLVLPSALAIKNFLKSFLVLGTISVFINTLGVLYGITGLWTGASGVKNPIFNFYIPTMLKRGITNDTLNLINFKIYNLPIYLINLIAIIGLIIIGGIIYLIWKK